MGNLLKRNDKILKDTPINIHRKTRLSVLHMFTIGCCHF